jgi:hypothetical protein
MDEKKTKGILDKNMRRLSFKNPLPKELGNYEDKIGTT